jgi:alpha-tubulin suppressor-like RCC1 family protein
VASRIALGREHACLTLAGSGQVRCWGKNDRGQLAQPASDAGLPPPVGDASDLLVAGIAGASAISAGEAHTCVIARSLTCWGGNWSGQLGRATDGASRQDSAQPKVVTFLDGPLGVAAGGSFACAIVHGGRVACWGDNEYGQLAAGPAPGGRKGGLVPELFHVTDVAAGAYHACAIRADRSAVCWGHNGEGQLGHGRALPASPMPVVVKGFTVGVRAIVAGNAHSCALRENGEIICWGSNRLGQLGNGDVGGRSLVPVVVRGGAEAIALSNGAGDHTCAIRKDRSVWCWGSNEYGELGTGTRGTPEPAPVKVTKVADVRALAAAAGRTCAVDGEGRVTCWGRSFVE